MNVLVKSRRVLELDQTTPDGVYFHILDEDDPSVSRTVLRFDLGSWEDMGRPTKITIAIEPGDQLNNVDQS